MMAARHWSAKDLWMLLALVGASGLAFAPAWAELGNEIVRREDNGYIMIVPIVAAYLAWIRRSRFRYVRRRPSFSGVALVLIAVGLGCIMSGA